MSKCMTQDNSQIIEPIDSSFDSISELNSILASSFVRDNQIAEIELDDGSTLYLSRNKNKIILHDDKIASGSIPFASLNDCSKYIESMHNFNSFVNAKVLILDKDHSEQYSSKSQAKLIISSKAQEKPVSRQPLAMINSFAQHNSQYAQQRMVERAFYYGDPSKKSRQGWEIAITGNKFNFVNGDDPFGTEQFLMTKIADQFHLAGCSRNIGEMARALEITAQGREFSFALKAATKQEAVDFAIGLAEGGVDVSRLEFNIANQTYSFEDVFPKGSTESAALKSATDKNEQQDPKSIRIF